MKKLELTKEAETVLVEAINKTPLHWGAWVELSTLITDKEKVGMCLEVCVSNMRVRGVQWVKLSIKHTGPKCVTHRCMSQVGGQLH